MIDFVDEAPKQAGPVLRRAAAHTIARRSILRATVDQSN
jgi:hypothetical protein